MRFCCGLLEICLGSQASEKVFEAAVLLEIAAVALQANEPALQMLLLQAAASLAVALAVRRLLRSAECGALQHEGRNGEGNAGTAHNLQEARCSLLPVASILLLLHERCEAPQ